MITTITVNEHFARAETPGFGFNTVSRLPDMEPWQWHEAVADMVANHHASMMGACFPCPQPPVGSTQDEDEEEERDDSLDFTQLADLVRKRE